MCTDNPGFRPESEIYITILPISSYLAEMENSKPYFDKEMMVKVRSEEIYRIQGK